MYHIGTVVVPVFMLPIQEVHSHSLPEASQLCIPGLLNCDEAFSPFLPYSKMVPDRSISMCPLPPETFNNSIKMLDR